jgi:queuosine precursor transporter
MAAPHHAVVVAEAPNAAPTQFKYYDLFVSSFVAVLLVSNIVAAKFISLGTINVFGFNIGPITFSGAQILFPIAYIFGDIFTEVYGYAASRKAIWNGFFASALLAGISTLIVAMPPAPGWENQKAYETVLGTLPRLVIASLIAYWCGEFANSFVLAKMKVWTRGKHLWTRTVSSTVVGQAVDSFLVMTIAFAGIMPWNVLISAMISGYVAKVLYEAAATPITYLVVNGIKKAEGVDVLDEHTDFSPFHIAK